MTLNDVLMETHGRKILNVNTGSALAFAAFPPEEPRMETAGLRDLPLGDRAHLAIILTDAGALVVSGAAFNCQVLRTLLDFRSRGVNPSDAVWFWYGKAHVLDDPHDSYAFFVVHDDKIVNERVSFSDAPGYGFDPGVFDPGDTSEIWSDGKGWRDAETRFWYRKFYRETVTGQLMVLRSDEAPLFHYPEGEFVRRMCLEMPDTDVLTTLQAALSALRGKQ